MKKLLVFAVWISILTGGTAVLRAQAPVAQKPATVTTTAPQPAPKNLRSDDKKEELCKKLLQRKSELRREEHEHAKERRGTETKGKTDNPK